MKDYLEEVYGVGNVEVEDGQEQDEGKYVVTILRKKYTVDAINGNISKKEGIYFNYSSLTIEKGKTEQLIAELNGITGTITWLSLSEDIATVNNGMITAVEKGTTTIKAVCNAEKGQEIATCKVIVIDPIITGITFKTPIPTSVEIGEEVTIEIDDIIPDGASGNLTWYSSDEAKLSVTADNSNGGQRAIIKGLSETSINEKVKITIKNEIGTELEENISVEVHKASTNALKISQNPKNYYGKTVNYSVLEENNWKIFYADSDNIYLIYGDYLPKGKVPTGETGLVQYPDAAYIYSVNWSTWPSKCQYISFPSSSAFLYNVDTDYVQKINSYTDSSKVNLRCVTTLLRKENWSNFVDKNYADYAIGSPTLAMFCESWNSLYDDVMLKALSQTENGYFRVYAYAGTNSFNASNASEMSNAEGFENTMFYPYPGVNKDNCYGYYLSAPMNGYSPDKVAGVYYSGSIGGDSGNTSKFCVRPVVRLRNNIKLVENTTNSNMDFDIVAPQS